MYLSSKIKLLKAKISKFVAIVGLPSILASIINIKFAKTNSSCLIIYQNIYLYKGFYFCSQNT